MLGKNNPTLKVTTYYDSIDLAKVIDEVTPSVTATLSLSTVKALLDFQLNSPISTNAVKGEIAPLSIVLRPTVNNIARLDITLPFASN